MYGYHLKKQRPEVLVERTGPYARCQIESLDITVEMLEFC